MKRIISLVVSLGILALMYTRIDMPRLATVFRSCHGGWMTVSLAMVVPLTLVTAWRLRMLMPPPSSLSLAEATKLILAASVLNMVLPAKMGDIAKAAFMKRQGHLNGTLALSLVVFEKTCDMLSLLLMCAWGLFWYPRRDWFFDLMTVVVGGSLIAGVTLLASTRFAGFFFRLMERWLPGRIGKKVDRLRQSWQEMHDSFWTDRRRLWSVSVVSVFIWFMHMLQIWLFILALRAWTPFLVNLALSPLAILAGLLPLTFAGVGTRDAALVFLYRGDFDAPTAAALGLLCTARYLIPAIGGLPFFQRFLTELQQGDPDAGRTAGAPP